MMYLKVPKNIKQALKDDVIKPYQQQGFDMSKSTMTEEGGLQDRLPDIRVKAGESISWSDYVMARTPEIWGTGESRIEDIEVNNSTRADISCFRSLSSLDCCEFKPERFIEEKADGEKSIKNLSSALFHSFNHGPRVSRLGPSLGFRV